MIRIRVANVMDEMGLGIMNMRKHEAKKYNMRLSALVVAMCAAQPVYALQTMDDESLRAVDGQDGISLDVQYSGAAVDRAYWKDQAGTTTNAQTDMYLNLQNISVSPVQAGDPLGSSYSINTGASGTAGIDFNLSSRPGQIIIDRIELCKNATTCSNNLGRLTVQSRRMLDGGGNLLPNMVFNLKTTDGLFNNNAVADLKLSLTNLNIFLTQAESATVNNQFITKDFNFNFTGKGFAYVDDAGGFTLETGAISTYPNNYVDLTRVADAVYAGKTKPGLNIELMYKGSSGSTYDVASAKGIIRVGASGRSVNSSLVFRGVDGAVNPENVLGMVYNGTSQVAGAANSTIIGKTGLAMRMKTEFTNASNAFGGSETTLELGHAGDNAYGFEFSNLKPLQVRTVAGNAPVNQGRATFDTGDVYLNIVDTKFAGLPVNSTLNTSLLGAPGNFLTTNNDYKNAIDYYTDYDNPVGIKAGTTPAILASIRRMEFQAISRRGRFIVSNNVNSGDAGYIAPTSGLTNQWGLGLPIYNLNANMAVHGMTATGGEERLGFSLAMSTEGYNKAATADGVGIGGKTTSILLVDGGTNINDMDNGAGGTGVAQPTSYYMGIRNIDMLLNTYYGAYITLKGNKVRMVVPNLIAAASGELAVGYLPGAKSKSCGPGISTPTCFAPTNSFETNHISDVGKSDILYGLKLRIDGSVVVDVIPGGNTLATNFPSFQGTATLRQAANKGVSAIQIVDVAGDSILGLDTISGRINFNNGIKINQDTVVFSTQLDLNPRTNYLTGGNYSNTERDANVLRIRDVNLYPLGGNPQRLGEMVLTGGTLSSTFTLKPRN